MFNFCVHAHCEIYRWSIFRPFIVDYGKRPWLTIAVVEMLLQEGLRIDKEFRIELNRGCFQIYERRHLRRPYAAPPPIGGRDRVYSTHRANNKDVDIDYDTEAGEVCAGDES